MSLVADLHIHTVASGHAYSTVLENARVAADKGLAMIAITDHGPRMLGGPHEYHFANLVAIPDELFGVRVLKGIEANIIGPDGSIDLSDERLKKLDLVMAGFHSESYHAASVEENTQTMINTVKNPWVDVIVHPGNPGFQIDAEAVVKAAAQYDVALEVNNSSLVRSRQGSRPYCSRIIQLAKQYGAKMIVGTDSHFAYHIGDFAAALALLEENGVAERDMLNSSVEKIIAHLSRRQNRLRPVVM
ncbi:putative phosphatase TTE1963 [Propionispora sp. 2/2-37]|uniref:phosphatase n=1 Tax=Propionispora sp. 2/2-37 TaxID=1677858 RepID=UPI0006BB6397|nr:phosphatase [Propionispora sp. 2/2-37]CUH94372.1 putative phosphatase TTE1963 [Propionispora sp. 2/2-37]